MSQVRTPDAATVPLPLRSVLSAFGLDVGIAMALSVSIMMGPGSTGIDDPPGRQAFGVRPPRMPPAISSSFANGVPSFTS